jgi:hypothetical protein
VFQLWLDQGHARKLTLADKFAMFIDYHPGSVKFQARFDQQGFLELYPCTGFDGINK